MKASRGKRTSLPFSKHKEILRMPPTATSSTAPSKATGAGEAAEAAVEAIAG